MSLIIKNIREQKTSIVGLSEICIQLRPQILSLLSIETPATFNHIAETKKKIIRTLSMYLATFIRLKVYN
jgi:hypothetical protein